MSILDSTADRIDEAAPEIDISVVMPCLNEADSIERCIEWAWEGIKRSGLTGEVVVSDNGSTDGSPEIAERAGARVVHQPRRGYGNAYRHGFANARGRMIVMADSDGTYDLRRLDELVALLDEGYDYVLGSRFGGEILPGAMPWLHRYVGNPVLTRMLNLFFAYNSSDAHSGMRAFTRDAYQRMELDSEGMEFASEIVIKAARKNLRVAEVPIIYHPRAGESKLHTFRDGWRHLRFMLLCCPKYLFLLPGLILTVLGLVGQSALLGGPVPVLGHRFDVHTSAMFALLTLVGSQLLAFGVFAKVHAHLRGYERTDGFTRWLQKDFTLERGLLAGGLLFGVGLAVDVAILIEWLNSSMGELDRLRPTLFAMSIMGMGIQCMFSAFFLSLTNQMVQRSAAPLESKSVA
ncbi:MAG: glycosyltransferase family 2 protein [Acidimicrobiales bacterium]